MWVDALCINPTDDEEGKSQMRLMGPIYRNAEKVVAFLGAHDETSGTLFRFLKSVEEHDNEVPAVVVELHTQNSDDVNTVFALALPAFLHRDYWTRAWIVQELILARQKIIQCGDDRVPYSTLQAVHDQILGFASHTISHEDPQDIRIVGHTPEWSARFDQLGSPGAPLSTIEFLEAFLDTQCKEPSDHINAFYHLFDPDIQPQIESRGEIFTQAVRSMIENASSLGIITIRGRQAVPMEAWQFELPSWCPFFGVPYLNEPLPCLDSTTRNRLENNAAVRFSPDVKVMHTKGLVLGKIGRIAWHGYFASQTFKNIDHRDRARHDEVFSYAHGCIEFFTRYADDTYNLHSCVLGDVVDPASGLLEALRRGKRLESITAHQKSELNTFAEFFHSRQLCLFAVDDLVHEHSATTASSSLSSEISWLDFAIIPGRAEIDDLLCAIVGCGQLVVLRPQGRCYKVIGAAKVVERTADDVLAFVGPSEYRSFALV